MKLPSNIGAARKEAASKKPVSVPVGAYVCKIINAKDEEYKSGSAMVLQLDIAEGPHSGVFMEHWKSLNDKTAKWRCVHRVFEVGEDVPNDDWRMQRLISELDAIDASNANFNFDGNTPKLKGKIIGVLFREEEFQNDNGDVMTSVRPFKLIPAQNVRDGNYKTPKKKAISGVSSSSDTLSSYSEKKSNIDSGLFDDPAPIQDKSNDAMKDFDIISDGDIPF